MLAIGMAVEMIFLSNIFLAIFVFLIANVEIVIRDILGWLYISILAFLFIKIVI